MNDTKVRLSKRDNKWLRDQLKAGEFCHQERIRAQILLMSDERFTRSEIVRALGTSTSTVSRTRRRFADTGCKETVLEKVGNRGAERALSVEDEQIIASIACTAAPAGHSSWTTRLVLEHARKKGVPKVGLETVRLCLRDHEIRPWREKNVGDSRPHAGLYRSDVRDSPSSGAAV